MKANNKTWIQHSIRAAFTALLTVLFLFGSKLLLPNINTEWLNITQQIFLESIQFSDLYFAFHRHTDVPSVEGGQVLLLDIHEYQTREEIAELLDSVAAAQPYMVALDVIFGETAMPDTIANQHVLEAVNKLPNLIYAFAAQETPEQTYTYNRSFFAGKIQGTEALANLPKTTLRRVAPIQVINRDTLPTFAYTILKELGISIPQNNIEWMIDYSIEDTVIMRPYKRQFNWNFLKNQIVIIGDTRDLTDMHKVPLSYRETFHMPGVQVHKQIVQTGIVQHWFQKVHDAWLWLITFVFLWCLKITGPLAEKLASKKWGTMQEWYKIVFKNDPEGLTPERRANIARKLIKLLLIIVLLALGYFLFWCAGLYFEVLVVIVAAPAILWVGEWLLNIMRKIVKFFKRK